MYVGWKEEAFRLQAVNDELMKTIKDFEERRLMRINETKLLIEENEVLHGALKEILSLEGMLDFNTPSVICMKESFEIAKSAIEQVKKIRKAAERNGRKVD